MWHNDDFENFKMFEMFFEFDNWLKFNNYIFDVMIRKSYSVDAFQF